MTPPRPQALAALGLDLLAAGVTRVGGRTDRLHVHAGVPDRDLDRAVPPLLHQHHLLQQAGEGRLQVVAVVVAGGGGGGGDGGVQHAELDVLGAVAVGPLVAHPGGDGAVTAVRQVLLVAHQQLVGGGRVGGGGGGGGWVRMMVVGAVCLVYGGGGRG